MSEFDRSRIVLVVAKPTDGNATGKPAENVGTGYFLTGDLVLTAGHIADRADWSFSIRAEVGESEEDRWSAAAPCWVGVGDLDAMLLRTTRRFGNWALPAFPAGTGDGTWKSAGYAKVAIDEETDNRKTLPLDGSFDMSLGQGPQELALRTEQIISPEWDTYWKGISGAPIFAAASRGGYELIGIITDANRALSNGLIGLPVTRLFNEIRFRSILTPSFLGELPATPWCLVITSEGSTLDLVGQVADVLTGFRGGELQFQGLHIEPVEIPVVEAVKTVENWATTVDALARADYLIADVTSFEPAVMLLLGVRSVLRRGVTVSVTAERPEVLSSAMPFNVRETRVLPFNDASFYDDLHLAMAEGAANLAGDPNYLDLPSYQAVRAPRPESWAENDAKNLLVLCSFKEDYSEFYWNKLRSLVRAHTGNMTPLRMLDLASPRLVGQALYEQVRWSSRCLVDWTGWRANVFFELGVRLACSEYDPLCIIQQDDASENPDPTDRRSAKLDQYDLLRRLLEPVVYDPANPRDALISVLESWSRLPLLNNDERPSRHALPPMATFKTAQACFIWQRDAMLIPPHIEQRGAAELIFGKDQERQPERLVLFADNEQFDVELRAAVREKWIAAWLYLKYLNDADSASPQSNKTELITVARLAEYTLSSSEDPRHVQLRKEIRSFLRVTRPRRHAGKDDSSSE